MTDSWGREIWLEEEEEALLVHTVVPVLPSRFALSDLGLMADLIGKMLLNWSSLCMKSLFLGKKVQKVLIFQPFTWRKKNYFNFLEYGIFSKKKVYLFYVWIRLLESVGFWPQNNEFGSAFGLIFGKNMVWWSNFEISWFDILLGSTALDPRHLNVLCRMSVVLLKPVYKLLCINSVPLFAPSLTLEWNLDRTAPVLAALQNALGEGFGKKTLNMRVCLYLSRNPPPTPPTQWASRSA